MKELIEYLIGQTIKFEVEGIKVSLEKEMESIFEKFSTKLEQERERTTKAITKLSSTLAGLFFIGLGLGFFIDTLTGYKGIGFMLVGLVAIIAGQLIKE